MEGMTPEQMNIVVAAVLFFIVGAPETYKTVDSVVDGVLDKEGRVTYTGLILHTVVFAVLLYVVSTHVMTE